MTHVADRIASPEALPRRRVSTFAALRHRDFFFLWLSILFASATFWLEQVVLAWVVYDLTDSPLLVGAITGMRGLPFLFVGPVAGVIADRASRKQVMVVSQVIILAFYLGLLAMLWFGQIAIWHLFVFSFGSAVAWSFNQPARNSLVQVLVPREELMNAVALQTMGQNITRILGPSAAGFLLATVGVPVTFLWVTAVLAGVMAATLLVRVPPIVVTTAHRGAQGVWRELGEGFAYVRDHQELLGLMLMALVPIVLGMSFLGLLPIFARDIFQMDARGVGELLAVGGVGSMVATLALASLSDRVRHRGALLLWNGVALGAALVAFAVSPIYPLSLVLMLLVGLFSMAQIVITSSEIQMLTPPEYMGRVMSIYMLDRGLMPVGSFAAGALAQWAGAPVSMAIMGTLCLLLVGLGAVALPGVRRLD